MSTALAPSVAEQILLNVVRTDHFRMAVKADDFTTSIVRDFFPNAEINGSAIGTNGQHPQLPGHALVDVSFSKVPGHYTLYLYHHSDSGCLGSFTLALQRNDSESKLIQYSGYQEIRGSHAIENFWPEGLEHVQATVAAVEQQMVRFGVTKAKKVQIGQGVRIAD